MSALPQFFWLLTIVLACAAAAIAPRATASPAFLSPAAGIPALHAALRFEPVPFGAGDTFLARGRDHSVRLEPAALHVLASHARPLWSLRLRDASATAPGAGLAPLPSRSNYYRGSDPAAWRVGVPHFRGVEYRDVYPGIDLVWHDNDGRLQYDFHLAPGARPERIRIVFDGVGRITLAEAGDLLLATAHGDLSLARPIAYQRIDGRRTEVAVAFELYEDRSVGFTLGDWDRAHGLVIDPVIRYASYFGGEGTDQASAVALDADGNRYITGFTDSFDIPPAPLPPGPPSRNDGTGVDAFVARFTADGELSYLTYLAGEGADVARAIVVDDAGRAWVAGQTDSSNSFPLAGPTLAGPSYAGGSADAFLARLNADGSLNYSGYLGGERLDNATALAFDAAQNLYVAGNTTSDEFLPVSAMEPGVPLQAERAANALDEEECVDEGGSDCEPADGFLLRITGGDSPALAYATYFGGTGPDGIFALAIDAQSRVFIGGGTGSVDLRGNDPDLGLQPGLVQGGSPTGGGIPIDGFVARIDLSGETPLYATYIGGIALDRVQGIALDGSGNVFLTGITASRAVTRAEDGFPVDPGSTHGGGEFDAFVSKLSPDGDDRRLVRVWSTYLGGAGDEQGTAIALDAAGQPVVVGETSSDNFPLRNAWQLRRLGGTDGFIAHYSANAPDRLMSSYLGGTSADRLNGVAVDAEGIAHVAGSTGSTNPPLVQPRQADFEGALDVYYAGIQLDVATGQLPDLRPRIEADPMPVQQNGTLEYEINVDNSGDGEATGVMVLLSVSNASLRNTAGCVAFPVQTGALLCELGDIGPDETGALNVSATPGNIGETIFTATVVRADQTDVAPLNNVRSIERRIVDNSGGRAAVTWPMLLLILFGLGLKMAERCLVGRRA